MNAAATARSCIQRVLTTHYEAKNITMLNYYSAPSHGSTKRYGSDERQKAK